MEPTRSLDSRIGEVIVFRSGALVTRTAALGVEGGGGGWPTEVSLGGLPLSLDEGSVRLRIEATAGEDAASLPAVTDLRVEWVVPPLGQPVEPPAEADLRAAAERVASLARRLEALAAEEQHLDRLEPSLPDRFEDQPPRPLSADALAGLADWVLRARLSRSAEAARLRKEQREAGEAQARLQQQAAEARAERGVDEQRVCKRVVARLRAPAGAAAGAARLILEYRVPGAGWRPSYVVRVRRDGRSATLSLRALVAQQSGEPWTGASLVLSTADLQRRIALPELKSQRIGRQQPEPAAKGWRAPPVGAESLFESLDQTLAVHREEEETAAALRPVLQPPPSPPPQPAASFGGYARDEAPAEKQDRAVERKKSMKRQSPPPAASLRAPGNAPQTMMLARPMAMPPAPPPAPAPAAARAASVPSESYASEEESDGAAFDLGSSGGGGPEGAFDAAPMRGGAPGAPQIDYHRLRLGAWDAPSGARGALRPLTQREQLEGLTDSQRARALLLASAADSRARKPIQFPVTTTAVESSAGAYDYSFRATGRHDVPSDGRPHNLPLFSKEGPVALALIVVPRESDQAVRVATLTNPLGAPLLAGPVDLYLEDEFLVASQLPTQPAGGTLQLGLGVEPALKVARNARFKEATEGLLGGKLALRHDVEIELSSRLAAPVQVEVRERLPVYLPDDGEVSIDPGEVAPPWEPFDQASPDQLKGGHRWRLVLAPGAAQKLTYGYTVRIDAKNELRGGNRRE